MAPPRQRRRTATARSGCSSRSIIPTRRRPLSPASSRRPPSFLRLVGAAARAAVDAADALTSEETKALIAGIPTSHHELYAAPVAWDLVVDGAPGGVLDGRLKPFLEKKIREYLGGDEPALVEHLLGRLRQRVGAEALEAEVARVLDADARPFVVKLWRLLLFEVRARQAGRLPG